MDHNLYGPIRSFDHVFGIFSEAQNGHPFGDAVVLSGRMLAGDPGHYSAVYSRVLNQLIVSSPWTGEQRSGMEDIRRRFNAGLSSREARGELCGLGLSPGTAAQVVRQWEDHMPGFEGEGFEGLGEERIVLRPNQVEKRRASREARSARLEGERRFGELQGDLFAAAKRRRSRYNGALVNTFPEGLQDAPVAVVSADHPSIRYKVLCRMVAPERRWMVASALSGGLDSRLYGIYEEASGGEVDPNVEDTGENGRVVLKVDTGSGVSTEADLGGSLETGYVVESIDDPLGIFPEGTVQGDFLELGTVEVILKSLAAGEWGYPGLYSSRRVNSAGSHRKVLYPISELSFIQSKLLYHGTPNKVGEAGNFSTEFVGAGEGAQVYGWGLYFAENRKISEDFYQKRLSDSGSRYFYKGKLLKDTDYEGSGKLAYLVVRCLARYSDDKRSAVLQDIRERFLVWAEGVRSRAEAFFSQSDPGNFWSGKFFPDPRYQSAFKFSVNFSVGDVSWSPEEGVQAVQSELQQLQEFLDSFDVLAIRKEKPAQRGYTYTVDLKVPDDLFIDWDKTWEGQPGAVRNRLLKAKTPVTRDSVRAWIRSRVAIGGQFLTFLYEEMGGKKTKFGDKEIAKAEAMDLRKTGIHGVRYLDGNSRRSGEGSHNYVIYDESDIETVLHPEKYDQGQMGLFTQEEMVIPSKVSASFRRVNSGASPGDHIELRFTSVDGSSDKFINMDYSGGNTFTATWGKFGTAGRQTEYPVAEWDAYYRGKTRKGYTDVTGGGDVVPQVRKAPPRKPPASVQAPVRKADPLGEWRQPDLFSSRRQQISDRFFIGR